MEVFAGEASCASVPDFRAVQLWRVCCVSCTFCLGCWSTRGSAGASPSSCPLFAGEEEEDEPDSVSMSAAKLLPDPNAKPTAAELGMHVLCACC